MAGVWSSEQVMAVAPDASSIAAARKLAGPAPWSDLGADDTAVWGACKGSGKNPYQTQVELAEPAYRCSCPSRKFPCKHALGLLLLWSAQPASFTGSRPAWVDEWLASRTERAEKAEQRAARADKPVDAEAQAARAAARDRKVDAGLVELDRWLGDLVRRGLAGAQSEPFSFWDQAAARLVDAQAAGLAGRVRELARIPAVGGAEWPARLLEETSLLHLAIAAHRRADALPEACREDVRSLIGFTQSHDEVRKGPLVRDRWNVIARTVADNERIAVQRVWLQGGSTGRLAVVLSFAAPGQPFDASLVVGTAIDADLAYFPSATPLRALVVERRGEPTAMTGISGSPSLAVALAEVADALAGNPFLDRVPLLLDGMTLDLVSPRFLLRDSDGAAVELRTDDERAWLLAALTGGHPTTVFGEWDHRALRPLAVEHEGRMVSL
jgi:hypothetical protein